LRLLLDGGVEVEILNEAALPAFDQSGPERFEPGLMLQQRQPRVQGRVGRMT